MLIILGVSAGCAALAAEDWKHVANDAICCELGWICVPLVTESYSTAWDSEAVEAFSQTHHLIMQAQVLCT